MVFLYKHVPVICMHIALSSNCNFVQDNSIVTSVGLSNCRLAQDCNWLI